MLYIGILVMVLIAGMLLGALWTEFKNSGASYLKKMPKGTFDKQFLISITKAYGLAGNIKGMLLLLKSNYQKGNPAAKVLAALDYLEHSRHQDYETALSYLSDHTPECEELIENILEQEIRKQRALIMKE